MSVEDRRDAVSKAVPRAERLGETSVEQTSTDGRGGARMAALARDLRLLLAGLWLGAAVYFSFAVAPSAFAVLPARELAGTLVNRTLGIVNVSGFVVGLLLLLTVPLARRAAGRLALVFEAASLLVLAAATAVGQWVIAARLHGLRAGLSGPVEGLAPDDPARVAFDALHSHSVKALTAAMLAALVAFLLIARRGRKQYRER